MCICEQYFYLEKNYLSNDDLDDSSKIQLFLFLMYIYAVCTSNYVSFDSHFSQFPVFSALQHTHTPISFPICLLQTNVSLLNREIKS